MSDENKINRRRALQVIALGVGAASTLPVLESHALGQHIHPGVNQAAGQDVQKAAAPRFFNPQEMAIIAAMSDLIIPADEHSPGAKDADVASFIDSMISESSNEVKDHWRRGLAAVEEMSQRKFSKGFTSASPEQQVSLLKTISRNERNPKTIEERFFVSIKGMTVDGYYTSAIGIHQELQYKGNAYLKDFTGCTHPEHLS